MSLSCEPCGKNFSGIESYTDHIKSKKHLNKIENIKDGLDTQQLECVLCEKKFPGRESYLQHQVCKKHLKKVELSQVLQTIGVSPLLSTLAERSFKESPISAPADGIRCEICDISCTGIENYEQHITSRKHNNRVALLELTDARLRSSSPPSPRSPPSLSTQSVKNDSLQLIHCVDCDLVCSGIIPYQQHLLSRKHRSKANIVEGLSSLTLNAEEDVVDGTMATRKMPFTPDSGVVGQEDREMYGKRTRTESLTQSTIERQLRSVRTELLICRKETPLIDFIEANSIFFKNS